MKPERGMSIRVADSARRAIEAMEPALRDELIEFLVGLAESPAAFLRRASPEVALLGQYLATFESRVHDGVMITTVFTGYDEEPPTLVLVAIGSQGQELEP